MKFITVRDLRLKPGQVWNLAQKENDIVVTANGRPVAILTGVNSETYESELDAIRRARVLRALDEVHRKSSEKGTDRLTTEEIDTEINAARKENLD
jgi:prevent-host-death family protein